MASSRRPKGTVGANGANHGGDVRLMQTLLNVWRRKQAATLLRVDGIMGSRTLAAIKEFQAAAKTGSDGRIDPGGPTARALFADYFSDIRVSVALYPPGGALRAVPYQVSCDALQGDLAQLAENVERLRQNKPAGVPDAPVQSGRRVA